MLKLLTLTMILSTNVYSEVDEDQINQIISESKRTRAEISESEKNRSPANSIQNWNDFERVMKDNDQNWEREVNNLIKEYE